MFDKSEKNIKKIELQVDKLYQKDDILLSSSIVQMMNNKHYMKQMEEENDYQNDIMAYYSRKHENNAKKEYNPKIVNLYHSGLIEINNKEYKTKDFFIVFDSKKNNYHLKCIDSSFNNVEIEYNKAVKFIDTTAFIKLINEAKVKDNKIIIEDKNTLDNLINNWDGYLHDEVEETEAIINKKMIEDVKDE